MLTRIKQSMRVSPRLSEVSDEPDKPVKSSYGRLRSTDMVKGTMRPNPLMPYGVSAILTKCFANC